MVSEALLVSAVSPGESVELEMPPAPVPAPDQLPTTLTNGLTLQSLEAMALENNPTLRQAGLLVRQAEGNWLQVGLYPNPTAGYVGDEINDDGTAGRQGVFVNQTVVTADKLELNQAAASWNVEQSRWQANAQRWAVINSVRSQFYQLLAAQRTVEIAEDLHKIVSKGLETAEELKKAGQVPQTDVLQAKIELNAVDVILQTARHRQIGTRRELAAFIGIDELPNDPLEGTLDRDPTPLDFESEWLRLQADNPVLQSAHAQVEQAKAQLHREQVQPIPDVQLQGSVSNDFAADNAVFGLQVGVMLPVHDKNQGNISAAYAAFHAALENVQRLELALRQQLAQSVQRYEVARAQVELYRDEILPTAQEALDLTTRGYESGEIGFLRLLTVRRTYVENQINAIAAMRELNLAAVQLDGLLITGGLNSPSQTVGNFGGSTGRSSQNRIGRPQSMITMPRPE
ncbi:TolC family protein [Thalassoroseus pseudoceratinae]|uniref:TolC family protein n=1 Tax=Thalassoroseus pseudoceratinae TaxID=2713176 RepID=UPI001423395B|nr:TolC family protein [Thalassoroseus pseudoceratinae]